MSDEPKSDLISTACDDCGKKYAVPPEMLGKFVKCKACGNRFTVAPLQKKSARSAPSLAVIAQQPAPTPESSFTSPQISSRETIKMIAGVLAYVYPFGWLMLALLIVAVLIGLSAGNFSENQFTSLMLAFPELAGLLLIVGLLQAILSAIISPEEFRAPWRDLSKSALWLMLGGAVGFIILRRRRGAFADDQFGVIYKKVASLVLRNLGIAAMSIVVLLVAYATDKLPKRTLSPLEIRGNQAAEQQRHQSEFHVVLRPANSPQ